MTARSARAVSCLAGALAAAAALATAAAPALANSYNVYACYAGQGTYLNPGDSASSWSESDNNGSNFYFPYDQCGGSTNGFGVISRSGYTAPAGDYGEVYFDAPAGLRIRQVQLWRSLIDYGIGSGGTSQRNYAWNLADGQLPSVGDEFDGSANVPYGAAGSGDTTDNGIVASNYLDVNLAAALPNQYAYVIGCGFSAGCPTGGQNPYVPSGFDTVLSIYGAIVTVEDDITPTLTLGSSGLLGGQVQTGTVPLAINASAIAGIARIEIYAGASSTPAAGEDFTHSSKCEFWQAVPCQDLTGYQYPLNTAQLPNGTYYITVKAYDPAGNVASVSSPAPVTIENPTQGTGATNGAPASEQASLTVSWPKHRKTATRAFRQSIQARGTLTTDGGQPIADALIQVTSTPSSPGLSSIDDGEAVTGADGTFAYTAPARESTRTLTFSYRAHFGDPSPSASAGLTLAVKAAVRIAVRPRHVHRGSLLKINGRLLGGPYPPGGKQIILEARRPRSGWVRFNVVRTGAGGRFRARYRFRFSGPAIYFIRAQSLFEEDYPYVSGNSSAIRVIEAP